MSINRRTFQRQALALAASATGVSASFVTPASAQQASAPVEGRDYIKLATPAAVPPGGKIDVIEFFWYEPSLETWAKKIPTDVAFRRVHVAFTAMHETHAKMFYALEQIDALPTMHKKVFNAMHLQRQRLDKEGDIVAFMTAGGVDAAKFTEAFRSFGVATKVRQSKQLVDAYRIDGVPAIGVHGRWYTAPSLTNGPVQALAVTDWLIQRAKAERK
jgi:protein dithiol oxidoreductase (disulfide-forming)